MFITEQNGTQQWSKMLKENFNVTDSDKLNWVSQYATIHEIHESQIGVNAGGVSAPQVLPNAQQGVGPMYATPLNTLGMGNPLAPQNVPAQGGVNPADFYTQRPGSGDIPVSTLPMALNVALMTIGLELLPVIPTKGPWAMLSYMDFPYAGGKMGGRNLTSFDGKGDGKENKPYYIQVLGKLDELGEVGAACKALADAAADKDGYKVTIAGKTATTAKIEGYFAGISKLTGGVIIEIASAKIGADNASIAEVFKAAAGEITFSNEDNTIDVELTGAKADFVEAMADFVPGFANFATGSKYPMTRAENETGTGNTLGLRLFSKWIEVGAFEVTGQVTRQQLQDLPLYGVDAVSKVMEAMQNELTQSINQQILEHVFRLGVTNAANLKFTRGIDMNLYIGSTNTTLADGAFAGIAEYKDVMGNNWKTADWSVVAEEVNTSAENLHTRQRRVSSRVLAAANLIQLYGRRGRPTWIVTNGLIVSILQDISSYVVAPMANNMSQDGSQSLYQAGTIAGLKVYVDPYMDWNDTRVCIGRKGNGNEPGAIFMPYILADTVSITAEGTMAPKMLVNSRYTIADAGFYPELQYYTFCIGSEYSLI